MGRSGKLAWASAAGIVLEYVLYVALDTGAGRYHDGPDQWALAFVVVGASTVVGLLLALRRPANPIGWLFLVNAAVALSAGVTTSWPGYALTHPGTLPGGRFVALYDSAAWPLDFATLIAIILVFPDGRLPFRRPRLIGTIAAVTLAMTVAAGVLREQRPTKPFADIEPYAVLPGAVSDAAVTAGLLVMLAFGAFAALTIRRRYRDGDEVTRSQVKWFLYAAAFAPLTLVLGSLEVVIRELIQPDMVTLVPFLCFEVALPAAVGIAVLRYRLYEIDRLINRTLVYLTVTVALAVVFAVVVLGLGVTLGSGSKLPTAAATLAVVGAFTPLRRRVQAAMDRRFDRARYTAIRGIHDYLDRLRAGRVPPEDVGHELARVVGDPTLEILYWLPDEGVHVDAAGTVVHPGAGRGQTPVVRGDRTLATVLHDVDAGIDGQLLDGATQAAALAIEIARLRVEVRHRAAEVEASRQRIVTAAEDERRRLERDLHDGAQQRLIAIGLMLRAVQSDIDPDGPVQAELDRAVRSLAEAVEELRSLAHGVRPQEAARR